MKKELNRNTKYFLATLIIAAGYLISCEKQDFCESEEKTGVAVVRPICDNDNRGSGDDEEDPIIDGVVQDSNGQGVENAVVEIFEVGISTPTDSDITDANGVFGMVVPAGNYYFKVTVGTSETTTNSVSITQDVNIVITI